MTCGRQAWGSYGADASECFPHGPVPGRELVLGSLLTESLRLSPPKLTGWPEQAGHTRGGLAASTSPGESPPERTTSRLAEQP